MGSNSILTNPMSLVALRNFEAAGRSQAAVQNRVSTGLKVNGAVDDASNFAIAQGIRGTIKATGAVIQGLNQTQGALKVAIAGAEAISDLLTDLKKKVTEAINPGISSTQYAILQTDIQEMLEQIDQIQQNAVFNGQNLLEGNDVGLIEDFSLMVSTTDTAPVGTLNGLDNRLLVGHLSTALANPGGSATITSQPGNVTGNDVYGGGTITTTVSDNANVLYVTTYGLDVPMSGTIELENDGETVLARLNPVTVTEAQVLANGDWRFAGAFVARGSDFSEVLTDTRGGSQRIFGQPMSSAKLFPTQLAPTAGQTLLADPASTPTLSMLAVDQALETVNVRLGYLGAAAKTIEGHIGSNQAVLDATEEGLGNIVDANMARESAELTAVQVRRQLAQQTLGVANQQSRVLLGLFQ